MNKKIQRKGGYLLPLSSIPVLFLALLTSCQDDLTQSEYDSAHKISVGSSLKLSNVKLSTNDGVELSRGVVYGAIKYNGKWLGARITKDRDKK